MVNADASIRLRAFQWLEEQCQIYGETLPRRVLEQGMIYNSVRIPFVGPQGIFKPQALEFPLTITTSPNSQYSDREVDGYLHYSYRGTDPEHRDNKGLREAMLKKISLIYLFGVVPGKYLPSWPVYIVGDNPSSLMFKVAVDEKESDQLKTVSTSKVTEGYQDDAKRKYLTVQTKYRLHQMKFRERVLQAYREQCAMCRLRHPELLQATHITPDSDPEGKPVISNGIALCHLHHVAFDRFVLGIRPDYTIEVRRDVLEEIDGPMLLHGLQGMHNQRLILPTNADHHPDTNRLELRYTKFKEFTPN